MKELIKEAKELSDKGGDAWPKFLRLGYLGVCIGVGVLFTGINLFIGNEVAWITVFIIWFLLYKAFKLMRNGHLVEDNDAYIKSLKLEE